MDYKWEAKIVFRPDMLAQAVYLTRRVGSRREYLLGDMSTITAEHGTATKEDPKFALLDEDQLKALGIAINDAGYKAPNEHLIEGKLNATEKHLFDMRAIAYSKLGLMFEADIKERPNQ